MNDFPACAAGTLNPLELVLLLLLALVGEGGEAVVIFGTTVCCLGAEDRSCFLGSFCCILSKLLFFLGFGEVEIALGLVVVIGLLKEWVLGWSVVRGLLVVRGSRVVTVAGGGDADLKLSRKKLEPVIVCGGRAVLNRVLGVV